MFLTTLFFFSSYAEERVVAYKSKAEICYNSKCEPMLFGKNTPNGIFQLRHATISQIGYGGDVLAFKELKTGEWIAIHRVFTRRPEQRRIEKLYGSYEYRKNVTMGCINVMPKVYDEIVNCCSDSKLEIIE